MGEPQLSGLKLVPFSDLLENVLQQAHEGLRRLVDTLPEQGDEERRRALLLHLHATRQRLQRLHVGVQWSMKARPVNTCRDVLRNAQDHANALQHAADELWRIHGELEDLRVPLFDVGSALHVLETGSYRLLPTVIEEGLQQQHGAGEDVGGAQEQAAQQQRRAAALRRMDHLIRLKLLSSKLPPGLRVLRVGEGQVQLAAAGGQYTARLTLVPAPPPEVTLSHYRPPSEAEGSDEGLKEEPEVTQPAAAAVKEEAQPPAAAAVKEKAQPPAAAVVKEEPQEEGPSTSAAAGGRAAAAVGAAAALGDGTSASGGQPSAAAGAAAAAAAAAAEPEATACWRWQLLSFELLPAAAEAAPTGARPLLSQPQHEWLQQHVEQRLWGAADVQLLLRHGKRRWVVVPEAPPLSTWRQQQQQAAGGGSQGGGTARTPAASGLGPAASQGRSSLPGAATPSGTATTALAASFKQEGGSQRTAAAEGGQQQQEEEEEEEEGGPLPEWAAHPLAVLHGVLSQAAGRLALWHLLLPGLKRLSEGGWKDFLKLSKSSEGDGISCALWPDMPWLAWGELQSLRDTTPYQPPAAAAAPGGASSLAQGQQQPAAQQPRPALELLFLEEGGLACTSQPLLADPLSGEGRPLALPLGSACSLAAERLLLEASARLGALLLAGVQAELQQADAGLAAAGVHAELELLPPCASPVEHPAPPLLQLWGGSALQLSISVQLRTGRLLVAAGPGLLEDGGCGEGAAAASGAAGGSGAADAAAAAAAAFVQRLQQQLDRGSREAAQLPVPSGRSRGMHRASLAAHALADACRWLHRQRALAALAAAAVQHGLQRALLPPRLLEDHLRQLPYEPEGPAPSSSIQALALPAFPAPANMHHHWAQRLRKLKALQGPEAAGGSGGAVRCYLLLDMPASDASEAAQEQQQQAPGSALRLQLAVCTCTRRGTPTRLLKLLPLPGTLARQQQQQQPAVGVADGAAAGGGKAAGPKPSKRKRPSEEEEEASLVAAPRAAAAAAAAAASSGQEGGASGGGGPPALGAVVAWCREAAAWEQLLHQLDLLPSPYSREVSLQALQQRQLPPRGEVVQLVQVAPLLAALDAWLAGLPGFGDGPGGAASPASSGSKPAVLLSLQHHLQQQQQQQQQGPVGPGAGANGSTASAGRWQLELRCRYLALLPQQAGQQGLQLAVGSTLGTLACDSTSLQDHGLLLQYSLAQGHSMLSGISDLVRVRNLQLLLVRLLKRAAAQPPAGTPAANNHADSNGAAAPVAEGDGLLGRGQNGHSEAASSGLGRPLVVHRLPGCGTAALEEVGLAHLVLSVSSDAPDQQQAARQQPVRVTVQWTNGTAVEGGEPAPAGSGSSASNGRYVSCRVACDPQLPAPVLLALAAQLEAQQDGPFLEAVCTAAHAAAALQQALTPAAQRAAGLLPGALQVLPLPPAPARSSSAAPARSPSPLRLRLQLQQCGRVIEAQVECHRAGLALLRLVPQAGGKADAPWHVALWGALQQLPGYHVAQPPPGADAKQLKTWVQVHVAWFEGHALTAAVHAVMRAVASGATQA